MKKVLMIMAVAMTWLFASCDDNYTVSDINMDMTKFIETKYPGARIFEADKENRGRIQIDIWHDNKEKEVYFNKRSEWLYTEWDLRYSELPQTVIDAIGKTEFASYRLDDIYYVEEPHQEYYKMQFEQGRHEQWISILANGTIL